ncbi:MAG: hypothetical protein ABSE51_19605 [Terracidiphilus sp.]
MSQTSWRICGLVVMLAWLTEPSACGAQQTGMLITNNPADVPDDLPNALSATPDKTTFNSRFGVATRTVIGNSENKLHLVVQPSEFAEPLNGSEKIDLAVRSRFTLSDLASTAFSASWSQMRDSVPHFGTNSGAFGERLGALALKQTSQSIFSYGIYANLFHDDPRYYVMGRQKRVGERALYSASRLVIARKDDGTAATNWSKFAGIASATAFTNAYYPKHDHGFANGAVSCGMSIWTSILNNEVHEFIGDGLRLMRRDRN